MNKIILKNGMDDLNEIFGSKIKMNLYLNKYKK